MSWRTQPTFLLLRSIGRSLGVNRFLARVANRAGREHRFEQSLFGKIRQDDCVWDVGANVGFYTTKFADVVGEGGVVVAFEPHPITFQSLLANLKNRSNVQCLKVALGDVDSTAFINEGTDPKKHASNRVTRDPEGAYEAVKVITGVTAITTYQAAPPNVIKIDVEGFELEVLKGIEPIIQQPQLRTIGIEVHFGVLQSRGVGSAGKEIEAILKQNRFQISWPDSSHIIAVRGK